MQLLDYKSRRTRNINHGSGIVNPTYTYNDASDILGDSTKSYTYDSLMRLISATPVATGSMSELYSYDKTGNRTTSSLSTGSTSYTTNALDQYTALTGSIYSGSLTYDSNGNIKTQGNRSYAYDYNNRIIEVTIGTGIIAKYSYDTLGRRASKIDPNSAIATLYIYHGDNIISEYKTTGSLTTRKNYINGIGTDQIIAYDVEESGNQDQIAFCQSRILPYQSEFTQYGYSNIVNDCNNIQSSATGVTNNLYYYHLNQLGSVIALTDTTGTVVQNYSYDAFGKVYSSNSSSTYSNSRLFTGREYDRETGLYYHRARYYDSYTGRFLSRDPIGQNDQVNLYTYVANSPLKYVDRMGKEKKIVGTLRIYSRVDQGLGHSWIEINEGDNTTTYGLWPNRGGADEPNWYGPQIYDGIQVNGPEISYMKDEYESFASASMSLNRKQLKEVNLYISTQIDAGRKWYTLSPCSAFASDVWNSVATSKLEDRGFLGISISTPESLRESILMNKVKNIPIKNLLFTNLD